MSPPVFHKASSHSQITREQTWKLQEVHALSSSHSWKPTLIETHHGFPIENSPGCSRSSPHLPCFIYWKYRIESFSPLYGSPQWVTEDSVWKATKDVYHSSMEPTLTLPCWSQTLQRPKESPTHNSFQRKPVSRVLWWMEGAECWQRHRVKNPENVLVPFPFNEPVV